jgi:hypothetical protein
MFDWLFGGSKSKKTSTTSAPKSSSYDVDSGGSGLNFGSLVTALAIVGTGIYQSRQAEKSAKKMADAISNNTVKEVEPPSPVAAQETAVKSTKDVRRKVAAQKGLFTPIEGFSSQASLVRKTILGG